MHSERLRLSERLSTRQFLGSVYTPLGDLDGATEKAIRDAGAIPVTAIYRVLAQIHALTAGSTVVAASSIW
jgi:hypothetical protein